jgi:hypothetical protein
VSIYTEEAQKSLGEEEASRAAPAGCDYAVAVPALFWEDRRYPERRAGKSAI